MAEEAQISPANKSVKNWLAPKRMIPLPYQATPKLRDFAGISDAVKYLALRGLLREREFFPANQRDGNGAKTFDEEARFS